MSKRTAEPLQDELQGQRALWRWDNEGGAVPAISGPNDAGLNDNAFSDLKSRAGGLADLPS